MSSQHERVFEQTQPVSTPEADAQPKVNAPSEVNFKEYLITDHRNAPPGARAMLRVIGGYKYYKEYRDEYNDLVAAVEESVRKGEMEEEDALDCLEECRRFE